MICLLQAEIQFQRLLRYDQIYNKKRRYNENEKMYCHSTWRRHSRNYCKCTYLAENGINILDISQTIVQGYFNMMMIVDVSNLKKDFTEVCDEMDTLGKEIGVSIRCQREEIFEKMHRL